VPGEAGGEGKHRALDALSRNWKTLTGGRLHCALAAKLI